ncbi:MAG TPA: ribonuclease HII [Bacteroidaceae bacterium]|nr:ribonuclease HII [Bacteroidaceae bacterium]
MLNSYYSPGVLEAGCDEAGRGCLAGPVFAAAVILPENFNHPSVNDSKKLSASQRETAVEVIRESAISYAVSLVDVQEIDMLNILKASIVAMHRALDQLSPEPEYILVDGNRFIPYKHIQHRCIIKGDAQYTSIAAASILAKTTRDNYMKKLHGQFPGYCWNQNKGYPTLAHRKAIREYGISPHHRRTFRLFNEQTRIDVFKQ